MMKTVIVEIFEMHSEWCVKKEVMVVMLAVVVIVEGEYGRDDSDVDVVRWREVAFITEEGPKLNYSSLAIMEIMWDAVMLFSSSHIP